MAITFATSTIPQKAVERLSAGQYELKIVSFSFSSADITEATVAAAPGAGKAIVVLGVFFRGNSDANQILKSGANVIATFRLNSRPSANMNPALPAPWLICNENEALNVLPNSVGTAGSADFVISYAVLALS